MNQNTNLPPGCLAKDVDPPMVLCEECDGTGMKDYGEGDCECKLCAGSGEVPKEYRG